jgi:hypothetical protein
MQTPPGITIERKVLLIEFERRCRFAGCNERHLIGVTRQEALEYNGFECNLCERWNDDSLSKNDVPDWWDEIEAHNKQTPN